MIEAMLSAISAAHDSHEVFRPRGIAIRPDRILRLHGYRDLKKVRKVIASTAHDSARLLEKIANPEVHYKRFKIIRCDEEGLELDHGVRFSNVAFEKYFAGAEEVVIFVMTLGEGFDEQARKFYDADEAVDALFWETAGWLGIEWMTKRFGDGVRNVARQNGQRVSCRMGPGYSYSVKGEKVLWQLEDQRPLFDAFKVGALPVELMESCAMTPKMSRSGLYGIAPRAFEEMN